MTTAPTLKTARAQPTPKPQPLPLSYQLASWLFENFVLGMEHDVAMFRSIADGAPLRDAPASSWPRGQQCVMPVFHVFDQHNATVLMYLFETHGPAASTHAERLIADGTRTQPGTPLAPLFSALFSNVTGLNPRRQATLLRTLTDKYGRIEGEMDARLRHDNQFVAEAVAAQARMWDLSINDAPLYASPSRPAAQVVLQATYPPEWLAYMFGRQTFALGRKGTDLTNWFYTLTPSDPSLVSVTAQQSKQAGGAATADSAEGAKKRQVLAAAHEQAIAGVKKRLALPGWSENTRDGTYWAGVVKLTARQRDDDDRLEFLVDGKPWSELATRQFELPLPAGQYEQADVWTRPNLFWEPDVSIAAIVYQVRTLNMERWALLNAITHLQSFKTRIVFDKPGRDGGAGTGQIPTHTQFLAYHVFERVASVCALAVAPEVVARRVQVGRWLTEQRFIPLRQFIGSVLDLVLVRNEDTPLTDEALQARLNGSQVGSSPDDRLSRVLTALPRWTGSNGALYDYQQACVTDLLQRAAAHKRCNMLIMPMGSGKSDIFFSFFRGLHQARMGVRFALVGTPAAPTLLALAERYTRNSGFGSARLLDRAKLMDKGGAPLPFTFDDSCIYVMPQDDIKRVQHLLVPHMQNALFCVDEAHLSTGIGTQRTAAAFNVARASLYFVAMTGTLVRNVHDEVTVKEWLRMCTRFPIRNETDYYVALADIVQYPVPSIAREHHVLEADLSMHERRDIDATLPASLGGTLVERRFTPELYDRAYQTALAVCTSQMIALASKLLADGNNVMLIAKNAKHVETLAARLASARVIDASLMYVHKGGAVSAAELGDAASKLRVCIMPLAQCTGYSAVRFNVQVSAVYPASQATIVQMEARIARLGQPRELVHFYRVHAGIMSFILRNHLAAASKNQIIEQMNADKAAV